MTKSILILVGDYVEDYEVMIPFQTLELLGYKVHVACPEREEGYSIKTAIHDFEGDQTFTERRGHNFRLNVSFKNIKPEAYDGLVLPGGRAPEYLRMYDSVMNITRHFVERKKPILLICHGIQMLTPIQGALTGKKVTSYYTLEPEVRLAGGSFQRCDMSSTIVHENIVSTPGHQGHPEAIRRFAEMMGTTFSGTK